MRILFAGGGTGGHLLPALNVASALRKNLSEAEFLFVGVKGGMEKSLVERHGFSIEEIEVVGIKRDISGMVDFSRKIMRAFAQSDKVVRGFGPEVVVGTGGYVSAPVVMAGKRRRARVLIQEQNIYPGLATRFLARFADKICLAFEGSRKYLQGIRNVLVTGNPLRDDLFQDRTDNLFAQFGLQAGKKVLLITGGSRGAQSLNEGIVLFLKKNLLGEDWQLLWQTGADKYDSVKNRLLDCNFTGKVLPFIDNMPGAYAVADLVVCRAGAMTISELLALGMPALLVPFPHATADHQMKNALDLKKQGAVEVIADRKLQSDEFAELLSSLLNDENRRRKLGETARLFGNSRGAETISQEIIKLI
ncbi:MAG: undecaprenyldiphospho-muramoylpentapeptide beta-N-acetylglucosaminyltransferase [candidate division Zixibacteria bacterium]|nr:undecaprenyldiphospho-muramoylpentapeptide beta-N-acetylglucosaminyltransferase [candidate division Zixibacteria bacterium]